MKQLLKEIKKAMSDILIWWAFKLDKTRFTMEQLKQIGDKLEALDKKLSDTNRQLNMYRMLASIGISYMLFDVSIYLWKCIYILIF